MKIQEEKRLRSELLQRPLCSAPRLFGSGGHYGRGNAGARGAGHWGPVAEGRRKAFFPKGRARDHLGHQLGRRGIINYDRELGSEVMVPT